MDGDYELAALYTEDGADSAVADTIPVSVDNALSAEMLDILENDGFKTQLVGTGGASVVTADGVMVTLPAGVLADDDRITIAVAAPPDTPMVPGEAVGVGVDIALASGQTTFAEAVTIALPYPEGRPDGLVDGTDPPIPETDLSLWFLGADAGQWVAIEGSMVDADNDIVVARVTQTGQFGIFDAAMPKPEPDAPGGGCAALPMPPRGPQDPTLMVLVALTALYLVITRVRGQRTAQRAFA